MKKVRLILSRHRFLTSILALAISLGALMTAPPAVEASITCGDMGCVNWANDWCYQTMYCCVDSGSGGYACRVINHPWMQGFLVAD